MGLLKAFFTLVLFFLYVQADSPYYEALAAHADVKKYEPMVAFMRGRPAMHRTESGWEHDSTTEALTEAVDILDYCKKKYPDEDVRNIVEASEMYTISKWCQSGREHGCKHGPDQTVRPYRCLIGEFQSDALLVPPHCNFSHEHNAKHCMDFFEWSGTATEKCQERGLHLQSFAMLQPCGLKVFTGVEYVCCPTTRDVKQDTASVAKKLVKAAQETIPKEEPKKEDEKKIESKEDDKENAYEAYLHYSEDGIHNEHERFRSAIKIWQGVHHEKISNMMKDWAAARKHVTDLRATDPKGAETLNKDLTDRFQKMYQALEQDGSARKRQLVAIHQQRIQAKLNLKKRTAMENYLKALENEEPTDIMKSLEHYIRAEEKDRIHTINHFEHIREVDVDDADRILPQTKEHLKVIDQRINQSMEMLQRVPLYKDKIALQIKEFMKNYRSVDESIKHVIDAASQPQVADIKPEEILGNPHHEDKMTKPITEDDTKIDQLLKQEPVKIDDGGLLDESKKVIEVKPLLPLKDDVKEEKPKEAKAEKKEKKTKYDKKVAEKNLESEVVENKNDAYMKVGKPQAHVSHHQDSRLSIEKNSVFDEVSSASPGSVFGIAIGSVAVFVIIIVAIVIMRKKAQRTPTTTGFVEIEQAASPEEKHVANMQMNGYENPTYKYFEKPNNAC